MCNMNNTVCSAFWKHTNIRSGDRIFPCCRFKSPVAKFEGDMKNILNSPEYDKLRTDSSNGVKISGCSKCYMEESLGKKSLRQEFNETYDIKKVELKYLEIGFDNICNLACDGCWGEWSSTWAGLERPNASKKELVVSTSEITSVPSTVEKIVFLGGEPLMTNRHIRFLKQLPSVSDIEIIYYTNGMFMLNDAIIELLKKARTVKFIVSVDAVGALAEKVRSGTVWSSVLDFIDQALENQFKVSIHSVMHLNSWIGFPELVHFVETKGFDWTVGLLTYPDKLSIKHLNRENKQLLKTILNSYNIPNREFIRNYLEDDREITKLHQLEAV